MIRHFFLLLCLISSPAVFGESLGIFIGPEPYRYGRASDFSQNGHTSEELHGIDTFQARMNEFDALLIMGSNSSHHNRQILGIKEELIAFVEGGGKIIFSGEYDYDENLYPLILEMQAPNEDYRFESTQNADFHTEFHPELEQLSQIRPSNDSTYVPFLPFSGAPDGTEVWISREYDGLTVPLLAKTPLGAGAIYYFAYGDVNMGDIERQIFHVILTDRNGPLPVDIQISENCGLSLSAKLENLSRHVRNLTQDAPYLSFGFNSNCHEGIAVKLEAQIKKLETDEVQSIALSEHPLVIGSYGRINFSSAINSEEFSIGTFEVTVTIKNADNDAILNQRQFRYLSKVNFEIEETELSSTQNFDEDETCLPDIDLKVSDLGIANNVVVIETDLTPTCEDQQTDVHLAMNFIHNGPDASPNETYSFEPFHDFIQLPRASSMSLQPSLASFSNQTGEFRVEATLSNSQGEETLQELDFTVRSEVELEGWEEVVDDTNEEEQ